MADKKAMSGASGSVPARVRWSAYGLFFVSGATALVYQVAWARSLTLIFGASHEAVGIVLASFMGGLALGGYVFGRLSSRVERPLRLYGLLEIGIAAVALVLPALLRLVDGIYVSAALQVQGVPWTLNLMRVALAAGVLLLPTFLMGGTLPVLSRLVVSHHGEFGVRLSQLYGINTSGAVVGALAAGFVLLPFLGVWRTQLVAVALNLAIGLAALAVGRTPSLPRVPDQRRAPGAGEPAQASGTGRLEQWALRLTFAGTAVSGMCALAFEVLWMRGISISAGTTTYSFTVMLAAFLVGIALGSWLHAAVPLPRVDESLQFGTVLLGIGVSGFVFSQLIPQLPRLSLQLNSWLYAQGDGVRAATTLLLSFCIMLVPCILMGMAFPLAGQARARLRSRFGQSVGDVVALNTAGAIVGSLAAGFVLIPYLGLQRGMLLTAAINSAYGLLVLGVALAARRTTRRWPVFAATAALAGASFALPWLLPAWNVRVLATFRNNVTKDSVGRRGEIEWDRVLGAADVLYYREGRSSNVSVIESGGRRAILIDGKSVASDSVTDMQHELLLGHLPVLLHPDPRNAAVVGLGAGITLGGVLAHPSLERVVLIEIEPAVVDGARLFAHVNDDALDDPRLEIAFQDGRNYLLTTNEKFDVITADPIHPWAHGASYLYTTEYYAMVGEHLTERGVMCQWLPLYELSFENVKAVVATFAENFRHTTLWQTSYDAVLIGSNSPLVVDPALLAARLKVPSVGRQLSQIGLDDPLSLLSELTLDDAGIASFTRDARRNTDDNLYLEFSSPLSIGTAEVFDNIRAIDARRVTLAAIVADPATLPSGERSQQELLEDYRWAKSRSVEAQIALQRLLRSDAPEAHLPVIEDLERVLQRVPDYRRARSLYCMALTQYGRSLLADEQQQQAVAALLRAVRAMPEDAAANFHLATALSDLGRPQDSLRFFDSAIRQRPRYSGALLNYGATLMRLSRFAEAEPLLRRAVALRPGSAEAHHGLALALLSTSRLDEAESSFRDAQRLEPELAGLHNNFARLRVEQRRYGDAFALLRRGLAIHPQDLQSTRQLAWLLATSPDAGLRDGAQALRLAQQVDRSTGGRIPQVLDTLAAALAESGRYAEATEVAGRAAGLAAEQGQQQLARRIRDRQAVYRSGRPFRLDT